MSGPTERSGASSSSRGRPTGKERSSKRPSSAARKAKLTGNTTIDPTSSTTSPTTTDRSLRHHRRRSNSRSKESPSRRINGSGDAGPPLEGQQLQLPKDGSSLTPKVSVLKMEDPVDKSFASIPYEQSPGNAPTTPRRRARPRISSTDLKNAHPLPSPAAYKNTSNAGKPPIDARKNALSGALKRRSERAKLMEQSIRTSTRSNSADEIQAPNMFDIGEEERSPYRKSQSFDAEFPTSAFGEDAFEPPVPMIGGTSSNKSASSTSKDMKQEIVPSSKQRQLMRQISALGLEDPVFGAMQAATKPRHPSNIFEDMDFADIPDDMKDDLSVASDHTDPVAASSLRSFSTEESPEDPNFLAKKVETSPSKKKNTKSKGTGTGLPPKPASARNGQKVSPKGSSGLHSSSKSRGSNESSYKSRSTFESESSDNTNELGAFVPPSGTFSPRNSKVEASPQISLDGKDEKVQTNHESPPPNDDLNAMFNESVATVLASGNKARRNSAGGVAAAKSPLAPPFAPKLSPRSASPAAQAIRASHVFVPPTSSAGESPEASDRRVLPNMDSLFADDERAAIERTASKKQTDDWWNEMAQDGTGDGFGFGDEANSVLLSGLNGNAKEKVTSKSKTRSSSKSGGNKKRSAVAKKSSS